MTTSKQDLAYGRQGGRIVPWKGAGAPALCDVCKQPMTAGQEGSHLSCRPALEEPSPEPSLFD